MCSLAAGISSQVMVVGRGSPMDSKQQRLATLEKFRVRWGEIVTALFVR
jgi:hypothetical protein